MEILKTCKNKNNNTESRDPTNHLQGYLHPLGTALIISKALKIQDVCTQFPVILFTQKHAFELHDLFFTNCDNRDPI